MKHAFIIFAHQLPEQLNHLIEQLLSYPEFDVFVHINKRNEILKESIIKDERVYVSNNNVVIDWGSDNLLKAMIVMFNEVLKKNKDYGQVVLCSGQDMIIRGGLDSFLDDHPEQVFSHVYEDDINRRNFLLHKWPKAYRQLLTSRWHPAKIGRALHWQLITHGCTLFKKKIDYNIDNIKFYKNFFWGAIPMVVVKWMMDFITNNPGFMTIYKDALIAEEAFTGTLIMMSPYKDWIHFDENGRSHDLTYVFKFVDNHPTIISMKDVPLLDTRKEFFARKFDYRFDKNVVSYYSNKIINK